MNTNYYFLSIFFFLLTACTSTPPPEKAASLNWEDQVLYFIMIDRFEDGNSSNSDQGAGVYDPNHPDRYHGGDLVGIEQRLAYLGELGATGIWITPPVKNQWWAPDSSFTGYHGYWASHFMEVDEHYGTLEEYKSLANALHARDMTLVQDVVVNHTASFSSYLGPYNPEAPAENFHHYGAPTQAPFHLNNALDPAHRKAAIYHFTPEVDDFNNQETKLRYQLADLDDLNTSNEEVRLALMESFRFWMKEVGVDGFRYDTPLYVEHDFWNDFNHRPELGMEPFAKQIGRPDFYTFGETWVHAPPFSDDGEKEAATYLGTLEKPEMDAVINFPLQQTIERVFAQGQSTAQFTSRMEHLQKHFPQPSQLVNFIDNHDMSRFRAGASQGAFRQALLCVLTMPGVPVIYQGTEQEFVETRANMFAAFDTQSDAFQYTKSLIELRKNHPAMRRGKWEGIADASQMPGLLIYRLITPEDSVYVAFNTTDHDIIGGDLPVNFAEGSGDLKTEILFSIEDGSTFIPNQEGFQEVFLKASDGVVFRLVKDELQGNTIKAQRPEIATKIHRVLSKSNWRIAGATVADSAFLVIDGNWNRREKIEKSGAVFQHVLNLGSLQNGRHQVQIVEKEAAERSLSEAVFFELFLPKEILSRATDPTGDDHGLNGDIKYPTHASFTHQMDLAGATMSHTGNNLEVAVKMAYPLTNIWNLPFGFDHLQLTLLIDLPDRQGAVAIPALNANMPAGMHWDFMVTSTGQKINLSAANGQSMSDKPAITLDEENQTLVFSFSAAALAYPTSLEGTKIYINTWDGSGEGDMRPLEEKPGPYTFGGPAGSVLIIDEMIVGSWK